ncbi:MAG: hypothetical protein H6Q74_1780 [Firmicutes bacterium]|nr:hypothetical protein [Bacillota bacterium]
MANETVDKSTTLMQSVTRMLDSAVGDGASYETLINVLALVCLVSILSRNHSATATAAAGAPSSSLHKILGDLTKGDGGVGPETLMSLLPLLNSPQLKSKINPATISSVLGLLGNFSGQGDSGRTDKEKTKDPPPEKQEEKSQPRPPSPPAAALTASEESDNTSPEDGERRKFGRYLNWKTNF